MGTRGKRYLIAGLVLGLLIGAVYAWAASAGRTSGAFSSVTIPYWQSPGMQAAKDMYGVEGSSGSSWVGSVDAALDNSAYLGSSSYIDARSYAACDGSTNDTDELQEAIDYAASSGIAEIYLGGTNSVCVADSLTVTSALTIQGPGTLKMPSGSVQFQIWAYAPLYVHDVTFDGNDSGLRFLRLEDSENFIIEGCTFDGLGGDIPATTVAVYVSHGSHGGRIYGNNFSDISATSVSGVARAIDVNNSDDTNLYSRNIVISSNNFSNIRPNDDADAISIAQADYDSNITITGNTFYNIYKRAVKIQSEGVSVVGNTITRDGIGIGYSAISSYGTDNIIADNKIVTANSANYTYPIDLQDADFNRITGNIINIDPTMTETTDSIRISGSSADHIVIANNVMSKGRYGIASDTTTPIEDMVIIGNSYKDFSTHVNYFRGTVDGLVLSNNYSATNIHNFAAFVTTTTNVNMSGNSHTSAWGLHTGLTGATNLARSNMGVSGADAESGNFIFEGATVDTNETTFAITDPTADRTITFQDATGIVSYTSDPNDLAINNVDPVFTFNDTTADAHDFKLLADADGFYVLGFSPGQTVLTTYSITEIDIPIAIDANSTADIAGTVVLQSAVNMASVCTTDGYVLIWNTGGAISCIAP